MLSRSSEGTLDGYAMMEYSTPQAVADAVFGMHGMILGDRDLEARLLDRVLHVPRSREWEATSGSAKTEEV